MFLHTLTVLTFIACATLTISEVQFKSNLLTPNNIAESEQADDASPLIICTWNIFRFGPGKLSVPDPLITARKNVTRLDVILDQLLGCDIAAIQEYMDINQTVSVRLLAALINKTGSPYSMILSPRLGRKTFEQNIFLYRTDKITAHESAVYPEPLGVDIFHREPFFTRFTTNNNNAQTSKMLPQLDIVLGTVHLDPEEAVSEITHLVGAFEWAQGHFNNSNVMIIGDYNADCTYVRDRDWPHIPLWTDSRFTWIVSNDMDTTAMTTHCAYTRAVYTGDALKKTYVDGSVISPDFPAKFRLSSAQAKLVSDHRMVRMSFC